MSETRFGSDEIRIGEALNRCVAHVDACSELYTKGRKADALLHAARPITDVLPWLETELRGHPEAFFDFTTSASAAGAAVRQNVRPRKLRKIASAMEKSADALLEIVAGDVKAPAFRASVALALLREAVTAYERAVQAQSLGEYQTAQALFERASDLFKETDGSSPELLDQIESLRLFLPALTPPARLATPSAVHEVVEAIAETCERDFGIDVTEGGSLDDSLTTLQRLTDDVVSSYVSGVPALSARLAASLYVRSYEPVRQQLSVVDKSLDRRLAELLGVELRRAINDGASSERVIELGAEGKRLLDSVRHSIKESSGAA